MNAEYKKGILFRAFKASLQTVGYVVAESRVNDIVGSLRKSVCELQTSHPARQANIAALHMDLENAVQNAEYISDGAEQDRALDDVHNLLTSLRLNILSSVHSAGQIAQSGVEEYFRKNSRKGAPLPRFSFKLLRNKDYVLDEKENIKFIADITDDQVQDFLISDHSLFQYVVERGGEARLLNSVPHAMRSDPNFRDPRIHKPLAAKYNSPGLLKKLKMFYQGEAVDQPWVECFDIDENGKRKNIQDPDRRSYYKSIFIVPITLVQGDYAAIKGSLFEKTSESGKVILGFLCIDHVFENFFGDEDEHIGWIYADIISLPLIDYFQYIVYSETVRKAVLILIQAKRDYYQDTIRRFLSDLHVQEESNDTSGAEPIITNAPVDSLPSSAN